jgi:hypothetical protein
MDTTATTPKRRRRGLAVALVLTGLVAAAPGVATLAGFTAQDQNKDNSIQSGTLDVALGQDEAQFDVRNMKPGDTTAQTVKVINTGSLREDFVLDAINVDGNLDDVLRVQVSQDGTVLAEGTKLSEMAPLTAGLASGESTAYDVTVSWPENAPEIDNKYQAGAVKFDFQVDATQLDGQAITNGDNAGN